MVTKYYIVVWPPRPILSPGQQNVRGGASHYLFPNTFISYVCQQGLNNQEPIIGRMYIFILCCPVFIYLSTITFPIWSSTMSSICMQCTYHADTHLIFHLLYCMHHLFTFYSHKEGQGNQQVHNENQYSHAGHMQLTL